MHIVIIAWLYVLLMMALTLRSIVAGVLLFTVVGCGPVLLYLLLLRQRRRNRAATPSVFERKVRAADDRDA